MPSEIIERLDGEINAGLANRLLKLGSPKEPPSYSLRSNEAGSYAEGV
jgi:hypothetical protein